MTDPTPCLADRYTSGRELGASGRANLYLAPDVKHGRQSSSKTLDKNPSYRRLKAVFAAPLSQTHSRSSYD